MEDDSSTLFVLAGSIAILVLLHTFFALASVAIHRSRGRILRSPVFEKVPFFHYARIILDDEDAYLLIAQIGLYFSAVLTGAFVALVSFHGPVWHLLDSVFGEDSGLYARLVVLGALAIIALVSMVSVQLVKAWAYSYPERTLCLIALPLWLIRSCCLPLVYLLELISDSIIRIIGLKPVEDSEMAISSEDIGELVEKSAEAGTIEEDEGEMLQAVVSLSDTLAREIMTPRKDVIWIHSDATLAEARECFIEAGLSRVLVVDEHLDNVKGVLIVKDLLTFLGSGTGNDSILPFVREAFTVQGTLQVDQLLKQMKARSTHFAVVMDEHGGVDGVITLEDLLEEIVGDIADEHDPEEIDDCLPTRSGDLLVDGSVLIDDLNLEYEFNFPNGEYDTIAGFVIHSIGRIPEPGELLTFGEVKIQVEDVAHNRILRLRIFDYVNGHGGNENSMHFGNS